jgi:hypothetical protein
MKRAAATAPKPTPSTFNPALFKRAIEGVLAKRNAEQVYDVYATQADAGTIVAGFSCRYLGRDVTKGIQFTSRATPADVEAFVRDTLDSPPEPSR